MAEDFGTGVSRTLSALQRQFAAVVVQEGRPPLDSEQNLAAQIDWDRMATAIRAIMPSGFVLDPTRAQEEYQFNPLWSNLFILGTPRSDEQSPVIWANVNGWIIPVAGTNDNPDGLLNLIRFYPPPTTGTRVDYVFLEAWQTLISPNPSVVNKPSASTVWKFGNVQFGGTNIADDLEDPQIGYETTKRVQVQYRLRVYGQGSGGGSGIALDVYPDGLGDPSLYGQGTAASPVVGMPFTNMRAELGDPSLWRAGDGNAANALGTVEGYVYAVPICAVFRRNTDPYVAINDGGNANQNGAFNRTPSATLPADARMLSQATLTNDLTWDAVGIISVTDLNNSGWEDSAHVLTNVFMVIDGEVIGVSAVDTGAGQITIPVGGRGEYATHATAHVAGTAIYFFNSRPDGLYADQIAAQDVLDLRRGVNPGDWDFQRLLEHNIGALARNELQTSWKRSTPGDTIGPVVQEVDYLQADGGTVIPPQTEALDGPDGVRTIWSDAAVMQADVTLLLDNEAPLDANNTIGFVGINSFDTSAVWDVSPGFIPIGFMNLGGLAFPTQSWTNGSSVILHIGGETGDAGARGTFRDGSTRAVRFVTPREYWKSAAQGDPTIGNQAPVSIRWLGQRMTEPPPVDEVYTSRYPGPLYPWQGTNFERPFIVLGGILANNLRMAGIPATSLISAPAGYYGPQHWEVTNLPVNFNTYSTLLLRGQRTLYDMLTDNGRDLTGGSSEVYVMLYGDQSSTNNNGAFKVIGAGGLTNWVTGTNNLVVEPLSADFVAFDSGTGNTVTVEFRSPWTNSEDGGARTGFTGDLAIVLTDIGGFSSSHPWNRDALGYMGSIPTTDGVVYDADHSLPMIPLAGFPWVLSYAPSKMLLSVTLLYHPGRSGMARVPNEVVRAGLRNNAANYLRQSPNAIDTAFTGAPTPTPPETYFDPVHISTWNRLPALGLSAPSAPNYGGNVVGFTEQDREHELFYDKGSKTFVYRPFRGWTMTVKGESFPTLGVKNFDTTPFVVLGLLGNYDYDPLGTPYPKDKLLLWTQGNTTNYSVTTNVGPFLIPFTGTGQQMGFPVPREYMPRFGRQDIPYHQDLNAGAGSFLSGINHLFRDVADVTQPVFNIIGGKDNTTSANLVTTLLFRTSNPPDYGHGVTGAAITGAIITPFYEARKTNDINAFVNYAQDIIDRLKAVNSSDFGRGLTGIQLPPYIGPARVIGVYDIRDFESTGGKTVDADRFTPTTGGAPNLLRTDADQQTLFILQDGAKDLTQESYDHTYIIPSNAIDISRALNYVPGDKFTDASYHFVVVATVFGFAKGFINKNNLVLARNHNGKGEALSDGQDPELEGIQMCLAAPAGLNEHFYAAYSRTVYQGDPYGTRAGDFRTVTDYVHRYGQPSVADMYGLATPLTQYNPTTGAFQIETPNPRSFEVLASLDFYTTLGTGKIGGDLSPGTALDVGFLEATPDSADRIPQSATSPPWRVLTRGFTEGQSLYNDTRGQLVVELLDTNAISRGNSAPTAKFGALEFTLPDGTVSIMYAYTPDNVGFLPSWDPSADINGFNVDLSQQVHHFVGALSIAPGPMTPGQSFTTTYAVPNASGFGIYDQVLVTPRITTPPGPNNIIQNTYGALVFDGWRTSGSSVMLRATYTFTDAAFKTVPNGVYFDYDVGAVLWPGGIPQGTSSTITLTPPTHITQTGDLIFVQIEDASRGNTTAAGANVLTVTAFPDGLGGISVTFAAQGATFGPVPGTIRLNIGILRQHSPVPSINPGSLVLDVMVIARGNPSVTGDLTISASRMASIINQMKIGQYVTAHASGKQVLLTSKAVGAEGNLTRVRMFYFDSAPYGIEQAFQFIQPQTNRYATTAVVISTPLAGGVDIPVNAGAGTSQLRLTGMTERLPLGILVSDYDFLCENPLGNNASAMETLPAGARPVQTLMPLTQAGEEYRRFLGTPGDLLVMADGAINVFTATGIKRFRLYRGGGSAYVLGGDNPGGPIDWVSGSLPASNDPVLKGGALVCRALLVRNFYEEAFAPPTKNSEGDEIQMVIITHGVYGDGRSQQEGVELNGIISPTGYGEGYAAADRYRLNGRPMFKGNNRTVPSTSDVQLAVYPDETRGN